MEFIKKKELGIQIKLHTCFDVNRSDSEFIELPKEVETLRELLGHLGEEMNYSFIDPETGSLEEDLEILINKKEIWFYPAALDTQLEDDDLVEIYLLPLGGG